MTDSPLPSASKRGYTPGLGQADMTRTQKIALVVALPIVALVASNALQPDQPEALLISLVWSTECPGMSQGLAEVHVIQDTVQCWNVDSTPTPEEPTRTPRPTPTRRPTLTPRSTETETPLPPTPPGD